MPGTAVKIRISEKQRVILQELGRSRTVARCVVQRATIIVLGFEGGLNQEIAKEVKLNRQQVGVWRQRWRDALCVWECNEPQNLSKNYSLFYCRKENPLTLTLGIRTLASYNLSSVSW